MRVEEIQFGGMLTMALLTLTLAFLLPVRTASGKVFSNARWLMAGATSLLFVQFLLQYTLHFRTMGVTQGVFINLLFFVPCAWQPIFIFLSMFYCIFSFICYGVSNDQQQIKIAEDSEEQTENMAEKGHPQTDGHDTGTICK